MKKLKKNAIKLNLGCGIKAVSGWINVDNFMTEQDIREHKGYFKFAVWEEGAKFVKADICDLPFPDNYADWAEMREVLEHFAIHNVIKALTEVHRVLKKGATLILTTPNMDSVALDWINMAIRNKLTTNEEMGEYINLAHIIYGSQFAEGEYHQCPFNMPFLNYVATKAGFTQGKFVNYTKLTPMSKVDDGFLGSKDPKFALRNDTIIATLIK